MAKPKSARARGTGGLKKGASGHYIARYQGADGRQVKRSTGTSDRRDAEAILAGWLQHEARIKSGLEAPGAARTAKELSRPLREHLEEYLEAFVRAESRTAGTMRVRRSIFRTFISVARAILRAEPRLRDLTPDLVERIMHHRLTVERKSARTANTQRQYIVAFAAWATADGRADLAQLGGRVKRRKEDLDRRRERRALTEAEAGRLCAGPRGLLYLLALETGMRRGEMKSLAWADIDLESRLIKVRSTKVRRLETVAIVTNSLLEALRAARPLLTPRANTRVFDAMPTHRTVRKDFERAGIAVRDEDGRVADLHALRGTLGSRLAIAGVAPRVAQDILRHQDYRTTNRHYQHLTLNDQRAALEKALAPTVNARAEGTTGGVATVLPWTSSASLEAASRGTSSGTSSGTSRGAKEEFSAHGRASGAREYSAADDAQSLSLCDFVRALAERCESVLDSRLTRTVGAVGKQPTVQRHDAQQLTEADSREVHQEVHRQFVAVLGHLSAMSCGQRAALLESVRQR